MEDKDKVINIKPEVSSVNKNGIIELKNDTEETIMSKDTYNKSEIDFKFDKVNSNMQHEFDKVDLKFDKLEQKIIDSFEMSNLRVEKMFSDFKIEQQTEREESKKWLIALSVGSLLSIIGIVVSIITIFVQK